MFKSRLEVTVIVVMLLSGCLKKESQSDIFNNLLQASKEQNSVEMNEVVREDWDRACYFSSGLPKFEVEKILGTKLVGTEEFVERLVFFKGDTLVSYDEVPYHPSTPSGQVTFEYDRQNNPGYFCFTANESRFEVHQRDIDGKAFYTLKLKK